MRKRYRDTENLVSGLKNFYKACGEVKKMAEIGCAFGESTAIFAECDPGMHIYCVDTWALPVYFSCKDEFVRKHGTNPNITIIQKPSVVAASTFADSSLDLVYIDADHMYDPVVADIRAWLRKVKPGGYIGGHDHYTNHYSQVPQAVLDTLGQSPDMVFEDTSWIVKVR